MVLSNEVIKGSLDSCHACSCLSEAYGASRANVSIVGVSENDLSTHWLWSIVVNFRYWLGLNIPDWTSVGNKVITKVVVEVVSEGQALHKILISLSFKCDGVGASDQGSGVVCSHLIYCFQFVMLKLLNCNPNFLLLYQN